MRNTTVMRELLARPDMLIIPGITDALGARIIEEAGFEAVYLTGMGMAASCGLPDRGLLTMTEVVQRAAYITDAVDIPLLCDVDTGYGSATNVIRTVREFERAGVAGIQFEDQVSPKVGGHFGQIHLISTEEMQEKVHAACDSRTDQDFIIIARTDAMNTDGGIQEAIMRSRAYIEAGADLIFVVKSSHHRGPQLADDVKTLCSSFTKPMMVDITEAGSQPILPYTGLETTGLKVGLVALTIGFWAPITAMRKAARDIRQLGLESVHRVMERNDSVDSGVKLISKWTERYPREFERVPKK